MAEVPLFDPLTSSPDPVASPAYGDARPEPDETPEQHARRIIDAARACVEAWETAESTNRSEQAIDLRFKAGDQWDAGIVAERSVPGRELPCLTFNEIFPIVKQTTNDFLQNKPGVQVLSVGGETDAKAAEVRAGMLRYITYASKGQAALEVAFESEADIGLGFVQVYTEYVRDDSFSQAIVLGAITDPFSVYYDTQSTARDGSDASQCVVLDRMRRSDFEREYPEAEATQMRLTERSTYGDWLTADTVYVAGYYCLEYEPDILYMLNDGQTVWHSRLADPQVVMLVQQIGFRPDMVREVQRRRVKYYKLTAVDLLEEHTLPGRHIPVVPFHGNVMLVDEEVKRFGMIRALRDPQQVENWAETTKAVLVGLQPKAPWVGPEGFMGEGAQRAAWEASNTENVVALEVSRTDLSGGPIDAREVQRQPFPAVPAALVEMRESARQYMRALSGVGQPAQLTAGNPRSGSSLREEDSQASMANYHYMANAKLSLLHIWQICLDWIPTYYTAEQVAQLLGEDGQVSTQVVNQRQQVQGPQGMIEQVLHDLSAGDFEVALTTGPNYETKRQEASDKLLQLAGRGWTKILDVGGSNVVRSLNMPGGEEIAKKLALTEPQVPGEDMDPEQALPLVLGQLQKVQQEAQQLNAHAQQVEQAAAQLTEENRELRMQQTALKAQMQGDAAEATVAQKMYTLQLAEQQNRFDKALLTMQVQMSRLQEQLAQAQTKHVAQGAAHTMDQHAQALTDAADALTEAALGPEANGTAVVVES